MKALVTGGAGFIGSHIADRLLEEGYEVQILDNLEFRVHPKGKPSWIPKDAELVRGDLRDKGSPPYLLFPLSYNFDINISIEKFIYLLTIVNLWSWLIDFYANI